MIDVGRLYVDLIRALQRILRRQKGGHVVFDSRLLLREAYGGEYPKKYYWYAKKLLDALAVFGWIKIYRLGGRRCKKARFIAYVRGNPILDYSPSEILEKINGILELLRKNKIHITMVKAL